MPEDSLLFTWAGSAKSVSMRRYKDEVKRNLQKPPQELMKLLREVVEKAEYEVKGGISSGAVKAPPLYGVDKHYYIPASSIKGALRSRLEYKFKPKMVGDQLIAMACYAVQGPYRPGMPHLRFWGDDAGYQREGPCNVAVEDEVCIVCDLFGAPSLSSRLTFSDLRMVSGELRDIKDLKMKVYEPRCEFSLNVSALNVNWVDLGLLFTSMELKSGSPILIGAKKYLYNRLVGNLYANKYSFGMLKLDLKQATTLDSTLKPSEYRVGEFADKAFKALEDSEYHTFLDYEKGVMSKLQ